MDNPHNGETSLQEILDNFINALKTMRLELNRLTRKVEENEKKLNDFIIETKQLFDERNQDR